MIRATRPATRPATVDRMVAGLVDGIAAEAIDADLTDWLVDSPRFLAFTEAYRDKIRKKLRGAVDAEARRDILAELRVARLLLADRRLELAFEAYGAGRAGPDFTVRFRGEPTFNVEVTRLHGAGHPSVGGPLLTKLRQLPPSVPNVLVVAVEGRNAAEFDVAGAVRTLRARADRKDEAFFVSRGLAGTRAFYDRFLRLGAVVVWCESATGEARATAWTNGSARIPLAPRATRALLACLRAG